LSSSRGIAEEVTSALSNLGGLRVLDRGSVNASVGSLQSARAIGAALRADALVDGDVQKAGDAIRVRVRLVDAASEESKWSQTYNHTSRDVFQVQSEVATRVAGLLRIQLAERESRSLRRPPTTNPEAYDAYLHARAMERSGGYGGLTLEGVDALIGVLTRAIELDSTFARAWAGLGEELVSSVFLFDADPARLERADSALRTALRLDSTVALAWKARGDLMWNAVRGWHFRESLGSVRLAIALQPSLMSAHASLGSLYFHYGFMPEARRSLESSLSLDPRDGCDDPTRCAGFSRPRVARVLWYEQKFDSALAVYESVPFLGGFAVEKAIVLAALGRAEEGLDVLDAHRMPQGDNADRIAARALMHAALRQERQALALVRTAIAAPNSRSHAHHAQFTIACVYARLGRKAEAVEWLRRTAEDGMPNSPLFRNDPNLRSLQGDPGYETLMAALERQFEANARVVRVPGE
jgi:TolB-like protein